MIDNNKEEDERKIEIDGFVFFLVILIEQMSISQFLWIVLRSYC